MLYIGLYILTGVFAGGMAGLLGIGGGVVVVPALALIFRYSGFPPDLVMHMAAGSSLTAMILTAQASVRAHNQHGRILWSIYRKLVGGIIVGVICGAIIADFLHTRVLSVFFGVFLLAISAKMLIIPHKRTKRRLPGPVGRNAVSFAIGAKSGMLGVGGGALMIPFLTSCNIPMRNTTGISALCSFTVAILGSISFMMVGWDQSNLPAWSTGFVYWPAVLLVSIPSMLVAPLGASLSYKVRVTFLRRVFAVFLLVTGIHMLWP